MQKRFEKLGLHRKQASGLNIWTCEVTGPRKSRRLHGYLLANPEALFHELPPDVRRTVTREIARVLKPGGLFVFVDSLQMGDKPGWDGLLEGFPVRFHEPYFRHYAIDDLDGLFSAAVLSPVSTSLAFLSKVMARRKDA